jgi:hypothetical protein
MACPPAPGNVTDSYRPSAVAASAASLNAESLRTSPRAGSSATSVGGSSKDWRSATTVPERGATARSEKLRSPVTCETAPVPASIRNTTWRPRWSTAASSDLPSGLHVAPNATDLSHASVSTRAFPLDRSITASRARSANQRGTARRAYAIHFPSGDHRGFPSFAGLSAVRFRALPPSAGTT